MLAGGGVFAGVDRLVLDDRPLELRAQARACYLGFIKLYDVDYFREAGAGGDATRCVRVSYLRDFSAEALDEATLKVFAERHGDGALRRYRRELEQVGMVYEPVAPGDRYTFCRAPGDTGLLLRDGREVMRVVTDGFAERFLEIWVRSEDAAQAPEWAFSRC
jgi:hypothetical protein